MLDVGAGKFFKVAERRVNKIANPYGWKVCSVEGFDNFRRLEIVIARDDKEDGFFASCQVDGSLSYSWNCHRATNEIVAALDDWLFRKHQKSNA